MEIPQTTGSNNAYLTIKQVAQCLNISRATYYRWAKDEPLLMPTHDFGPRSPRVERARVMEFVERKVRVDQTSGLSD